MDTATTSGIASPRAWGQAIIMTVTERSTANPTPLPNRDQATKVITPAVTATTTSSMAARSARSWVRERLSCAFLTTSITWLRYVSLPVRRISTTSEPSLLTEPPMTSSPALLATGIDSPVSRDSSTCDEPSRTSPSAGTFSPGLTRTRLPTPSSLTFTSLVPPSTTTWAMAGMTLASSSSALDAPITERISTMCPSSMMSISVASSQKKMSFPKPNTDAEL